MKKLISFLILMHTCANVVPGFSFSATGVSISLGTTDKAWQIASSVIISC
jgi:hypothetical protein